MTFSLLGTCGDKKSACLQTAIASGGKTIQRYDGTNDCIEESAYDTDQVFATSSCTRDVTAVGVTDNTVVCELIYHDEGYPSGSVDNPNTRATALSNTDCEFSSKIKLPNGAGNLEWEFFGWKYFGTCGDKPSACIDTARIVEKEGKAQTLEQVVCHKWHGDDQKWFVSATCTRPVSPIPEEDPWWPSDQD